MTNTQSHQRASVAHPPTPPPPSDNSDSARLDIRTREASVASLELRQKGQGNRSANTSRSVAAMDSATVPDSTPTNDPASEISPLTMHVQAAVNAIYQLQLLGLHRMDIPIPQCVVLGEQSTGKSSVIEAISEIKTPRADDTCTRCPLYIQLGPSEGTGWSAVVSFKLEYAWDGKKERGRRFPGWYPKPQPSHIEFAATDRPEELEEIIRRAQLAIISPMVDYREFLRPSLGSVAEHRDCEFSPNVVCIAIAQPNLPQLSFYDLPGIIGQAEDESSQFLVKFVKDLVTEYVKNPQALILNTCSLENDIANSTAGGIARTLKATDRCVGVLTKPDRLPAGSSHAKLQQVLDGKRFPLGHGYFVVKNLGQDEIDGGLTHKQARLKEEQFFDQVMPWADEYQQYKSRFGTVNLQHFLSKQLAQQIMKQIPVIENSLTTRIEEVDAELQMYPEPPTHNAQRIIFDILHNFSNNVRQEIEAEFPHSTWRTNWDELQGTFFKGLLSLKPTMALNGLRDKGIYLETIASNLSGASNETVVLNDSDDEEQSEDAEMSDGPATPSKKRKVESTPGPSPLKKQAGQNDSPKPGEIPGLTEKRLKFQLDKVAEHLDQNSKALMPGYVEPRVLYAMTLEALNKWDLPLNAFFDAFEQQMMSQIKNLFEKHFKKWAGSALPQAAWKIVKEMVQLNLEQQRTVMAADSLRAERIEPYIFHRAMFNQEKEAMLQYYAEARFKARLGRYKAERLKQTGKALTPIEEGRLKRDEKFMAILGKDPYKEELGVVAEVTTYFVYAARRFHDSVCMPIKSKFFLQLRTQLREEMENALAIHDGAEGYRNAVDLLAEQSDRERRRRDLVAMKDSLIQGQKLLDDLKKKRYTDGPVRSSSTSTVYEDDEHSPGMSTPVEEMDAEI